MNNRYGFDVTYFKKELSALSRSLPDRTPDELSRYLVRLSEVAKPQDAKPAEVCSSCAGCGLRDKGCMERPGSVACSRDVSKFRTLTEPLNFSRCFHN